MRILKKDIDYAIGTSVWDLGNEVLYRLCREHPKHDRDDEIIAKVWLIGRSYAAAIERRKIIQDTSDRFYEKNVAETIRYSDIDKWLTDLPDQISTHTDLHAAIVVHKKLLVLFQRISGLEKRSLASKYLHFHCPSLFYIYDSRARSVIARLTPSLHKIKKEIRLSNIEATDWEYRNFSLRAHWLRQTLEQEFARPLCPRVIDKVLLNVEARERKT
jgi:hypothetical protein